MKDKVCFKSDTSAQIIILTGFVIAVIIVGMGTVLYSVANSGQQTSILQSDRAYNNFENIREEYGIALMVSSDYGEINPFDVSNTTIILEFEDRMKTIVESHGFILNFTGYEYIKNKNRAIVNILFTDGKKVFNDTVTYNLLTGEIIYDTIPPGRIYDLYAEAPDPNECTGGDGLVELYWTAVGNDYYEDTSAYKYEIRYSNEPIDTPALFDNATFYRFSYYVGKNGSEQNYIVEDLDPVPWHFAIKVYDKAGNFNYSNSANETASEWAPEIYNISGNNTPINFNVPELQVDSNTDVTIEFNVTDRDGHNVSISFMIKNSTSGWIPGDYWADVSPAQYNNEIFNYTFKNIQVNWDFYINVTDNSTCERSRTSPEGAPDYNYTINLTDYTPPDTIIINSTDDILDTYIDQKDPTNSHDLNNILIDGQGGKIKRGLIWFNLSNIPEDANIIYAYISLNASSADVNYEIEFHRINNSWDETENWDDNVQFDEANYSSNYPNNIGYTKWDVTDDIKYYIKYPNCGWIIKYSNDVENNSPDQPTSEFYDKSVFGYSPFLYVEYY
jgi:hypothetical protein